LIFDNLFSGEWGSGFPPHRREPQKTSRQMLTEVSVACHPSFPEILNNLQEVVVKPALTFPTMPKLLDVDHISDNGMRKAIQGWL
jgi:hypothetical protein